MVYLEENLIKIARRENNVVRPYLVVDPLQGKHVPVAPGKALQLFRDLAAEIMEIYKGERILFVGFAETATAIGIQVAIEIGAKYIQTTREQIAGVEYMYFSEEHSHATEQKLIRNDIDLLIKDIDRLIFVEDEVTTGKTILNIVDILEREYSKKIHISVISILNGMQNKHVELYRKRGIVLHYLIKTDQCKYSEWAEEFAGNGTYIDCDISNKYNIEEINISGWMDTRRVVDAGEYSERCNALWKQMYEMVGSKLGESILIIGTEEFMYPALYIGEQLEKQQKNVKCHSTTRSPIVVSSEEDYPLHTRYELRSLYEKRRITYLYNIDTYDDVIVVTDAQHIDSDGKNSVVNALMSRNEKVHLIRWC